MLQCPQSHSLHLDPKHPKWCCPDNPGARDDAAKQFKHSCKIRKSMVVNTLTKRSTHKSSWSATRSCFMLTRATCSSSCYAQLKICCFCDYRKGLLMDIRAPPATPASLPLHLLLAARTYPTTSSCQPPDDVNQAKKYLLCRTL